MKSLMRRFDVWAAKRLFFPIIVRVCQATGMSQFGFAGYAAIISVLFWIPMLVGGDWAQLFMQIVMGTIIVAMVVVIGIRGELPSAPRPFWRGYGWLMIAYHLLLFFISNDNDDRLYMLGSWVAMLFAEYAFMIDRIPPLEKEQKEPEIRAAEAY